MAAILGRHAQPVPRRASVASHLARGAALLEQRERGAQSVTELVARQGLELLLGIVQVVDVDRLGAEVAATAPELVRKEARRQAVRAAHDLLRAHDAGVEELALEVGAKL